MAETEGLKLLLKEAAFFQDFDDATLNLIVPSVTAKTFDAGHYILRDGEAADTFYLVRHGTVAIELAAPPRGRLSFTGSVVRARASPTISGQRACSASGPLPNRSSRTLISLPRERPARGGARRTGRVRLVARMRAVSAGEGRGRDMASA